MGTRLTLGRFFAYGFSPLRGLATAGSPMSTIDAYRSIKAGIAPATGRNLQDVAAEVWGHVAPADRVPPGQRSARKLLSRPLRGPHYVAWYPPRPESLPFNEFKLTEQQERWKQKLKGLRANGKGPPKKGAGKRSKKK